MGIEKIAAASLAEIRQNDKLENFGYTDLSGLQLSRLINISQNEILDDINEMYLKNPIAYRVVQAMTRHVIGDGMIYKAKEEEVQKVLDEYWNINKWGIKLETKINDLAVNGELLIRPEITPNSAIVMIDTIYPGLITERKKKNKFSDEMAAFKLANDEKDYYVINWDLLTESYTGDVFYFYINKPSHMNYGLSDLFFGRDWLKTYDKSLFSTMSRIGMILSFVWDVLVKTNDVNTLKKKMKEIQMNPPVPGSVRVHNESEEWKAESPNLNGGDLDNIYRILKGQCLTPSGTPEFMLGIGGNVNYASSKSMLKPYYREVGARQRYIEYMFRSQFDYVIFKKKKAGMLPNGIDTSYSITLPDPDTDKINDYAASLLQVSNAVILLETNGVIQSEDSKRVISMLMNILGIDMSDSSDDSELSAVENKILSAFKRYGNKTA